MIYEGGPDHLLKSHKLLKWSYFNNLPRIEKKIMNPADICTTLRLPTRVKASRPAFSLFERKADGIHQEIVFPFLSRKYKNA